MDQDHRHNPDAEDVRPLVELISAYRDDRDSLSADELARVETLLEEDSAARQIHAELGVITSGLQSLEPIPAPRSFHLDAEMVGAPEPVVLQESQAWYVRQAATVRWATAAAAVLFVFVLGADLVLNGIFASSSSVDSYDTGQTDESAIMSQREEESVAGDTGGDEAVDDAAVDAAGGGAEAPVVTTQDDAANVVSPEASDGAGAAELAPAPATATATATEAVTLQRTYGEEPQDTAAQGANTDDSALAVDADQGEAGSNDEARRPWRIAEFSLVVLLGLLITALVVLPRLGRASPRRGNN